MVSKKSVIVLTFLFLSSIPVFADNPTPDTVYDIQCGCFANHANAGRLVHRFQKLGLSWYSRQLDLCTRFIVDVNVDRNEKSPFIRKYPEFADAFLVENIWDLPRPDPEQISPLPSKKVFIHSMTPYMQRQYQYGYYNSKNLPMARERAKMYTRFIYEAAGLYRIDPFLLFALGNFESYFRNLLGDLDRLKYKNPDPAQGMFQILRSTARSIHRDMKKQKMSNVPKQLPKDLRPYPKLQVYLAAHYLHKLLQQQHGNRYMALLAYNSKNNPNYDYPRLVMRFYQRACRYFIKSFQ